jgi:hypothetical protein
VALVIGAFAGAYRLIRHLSGRRPAPISTSRACQQPWELSPDGEANVARLADSSTDFGRPTAPSRPVPEVDLATVRQMRERHGSVSR